ADAHDGSPRLAAREENHGRDREDVVPRGDSRLLVHVQPRDLDGQLLEDRLERLARAAPGRPEVDKQRSPGDRLVERRPVELGHSFPLNAVNRSRGTLHTASSATARLIFDWPAVRSVNTIGTSTTRKPLRRAR